MATVWKRMTPSARNKYISQDYVYQKELIPRHEIDFDELEDDTSYWGSIVPEDEKGLKYVVILLYLDGYSTEEIAYHVKYSRRHIYRIIEEFKKKSVKKLT
jgi:hypothetical protein